MDLVGEIRVIRWDCTEFNVFFFIYMPFDCKSFSESHDASNTVEFKIQIRYMYYLV